MAQVWVKIKSFFSNITIEPLFFFYAMCIGFYAIASKTLYIQKVCKVNFNISEEICNNIQRHEEEQNKVQAYVSQLQAYNDIIQGIIPFVLAIFAGPWSDIYGRRNLMISAVFGYSLCNLVFFLNTLYFYELKAEFLLFEAIQDCTGGSTMFYLASYSYLADISDPKTRTTRFALMDGVFPIGFYIGNALASPVAEKLGFLYNFAFGMLFSLLGCAYVVVFVGDSRIIRDQRLKKENDEKVKALKLANKFKEAEEIVQEEEARLLKARNPSLATKDLFNFKNVKTCINTIFKKRHYHTRTLILCLIVAFELEYFVWRGQMSTFFLYLRKQLKFEMGTFARYITISGIFGLLGQYVVLPFLSRRLGLRDSLILLIENVTGTISLMLYGYATHEWMLYLGSAIGVLTSTGTTLVRSMLSKMVSGTEIGSIFTGIAILQAMTPFAASPTYNMIYGKTLTYFPQAIVYLSVCLKVVMFMDVIFVHFVKKKDEKIQKQHNNDGCVDLREPLKE